MKLALVVAMVAGMVGCEAQVEEPHGFGRIEDTFGSQWTQCTFHRIWSAQADNGVWMYAGRGKEVMHCDLNEGMCGPCLPIPKELQ